MLISPADIEAHAGLIRSAGVFVTQLEQPIEAALRALEIARKAGRDDHPQPGACRQPARRIYTLCDYVTPNETEAEELTGIKVSSIDDARRAADSLLAQGRRRRHRDAWRKRRALAHGEPLRPCPRGQCRPGGRDDRRGRRLQWRPGRRAVDSGSSLCEAVRFACAVAGISVTRPGTAPSMPTLQEVEALLSKA